MSDYDPLISPHVPHDAEASSVTSSQDEISALFFTTPLPLIGLIGCVERHQVFLQKLAQNTQARMEFISLPKNHTLPQKKSKPSNGSRGPRGYEGYQPSGIVKAEWCDKHRLRVPALFVLFFEWDDNQNWDSRELTICERVASVRYNNRTRNLTIMVVIIRDGHFEEEQKNLDEKLSNLRKRAGLDQSKSSVFLLDTFELRTNLSRLESVWYTMATEYYLAQIRRIKKLKEKVNKHSQSSLFCRHHFKVAYFSEFCHDFGVALKYYQSAFQYLVNVRTDSLKLPEVKAVAYLVNFKICRILIRNNKLNEAAEQFHYHIKTYKELNGFPETVFQHYAWLAQQYETFGDFLERLNVKFNPSVRHQHPGFYFQNAARYTGIRRNEAEILLKQSHIDVNELKQPSENPSYFGQIGSGLQKDTHDEIWKDAHFKERNVNYSKMIVDSLTKAYSAFLATKSAASSRSTLQIYSQIAMEHYRNKNYKRAKKYLTTVADKYRTEGWDAILTDILRCTVDCAEQLADISDIITYSLELMQTNMTTALEEKMDLQRKLEKAIQVSDVSSDEAEVFDISSPHPLISCKASFSNGKVEWNETVEFSLQISTSFPLPVNFSSIEVCFNIPAYNINISPPDASKSPEMELGEGSSFTIYESTEFQSNQKRTYIASFGVQEMKHDLECTEVMFHYGCTPNSVTLECTPNHMRPDNPLLAAKYPVLSVIPTTPKLHHEIYHAAPGLVREYYGVTIVLKTWSDTLQDGTISFQHSPNITLYCKEDGTGEVIPMSALEGQTSTLEGHTSADPQLRLNAMRENEVQTVIIYARSTESGVASVQFQILYHREKSALDLHCSGVTALTFRQPFQMKYRTMADTKPLLQNQGKFDVVHLNDQLLVHIQAENVSEHTLEFNSLSITMNDEDPIVVSSEQIELLRKDVYTSMFVTCPPSLGHVPLGTVDIQWRRKPRDDSEDHPMISFQSQLPQLDIQQPTFEVTVDYPTSCILGTTFCLRIAITNTTNQVQEVAFGLGPQQNIQCLISGRISGIATVLPLVSHSLTFNVAPLLTGHVRLPQISLTSCRYKKALCDPESYGYIYVEPRQRFTSELEHSTIEQ